MRLDHVQGSCPPGGEEVARAFYRDALGLHVTGESENYGVEQEHLNQVFGARLHITGLRAERGPGIEFLEYIAPLADVICRLMRNRTTWCSGTHTSLRMIR